jgi:hypothetical protein
MFGAVPEAWSDARNPYFGGIAPGLDATALALLDPVHDEPLAVHVVTSGRSARAGLQRYAGFHRMAVGTLRRLERHGEPVMLAIRGYSMGGRPRVHCELIELGALLRWHLLRRKWPLSEIPGGTLHKFATGGGSPDPTVLAARLAALYRRSFGSLREAEAYGLAHIARALIYPDAYSSERIQALAQIARMRAVQAQFAREAAKGGKWGANARSRRS